MDRHEMDRHEAPKIPFAEFQQYVAFSSYVLLPNKLSTVTKLNKLFCYGYSVQSVYEP